MSWFKPLALAVLLAIAAYHLWVVGDDRAQIGAVFLGLVCIRNAYQSFECLADEVELASLRRRASVVLEPYDEAKLDRLMTATEPNVEEIMAETKKLTEELDRGEAQQRLTRMKAGIHLPGDRSYAS